MLRVAAAPQDDHEGPRRIFRVSPAVARRIGAADGQMCEVANPGGPSLRGWARIRQDEPDDRLSLGPFACAVLRCRAGDLFELRRIG